MELLFMVAVVYGMAYGVVRGTERAKGAVSRGYQARKKSWAKTKGSNPAARRAGAGVARGLGTAVTGTGLAVRGFREGWRQGWPEGREKAQKRWGHLKDQPPPEPPPSPKKPEPKPDALRLVKTRPTGAEQPTKKEEPMPTATRTGGEVLTYTQLVQDYDRKAAAAAAEMEDQAAAIERYKQDAAAAEVAAASMSALDLDRESISEASVQCDYSAEIAAAQQLLAAAEARSAAALAAKANLVRRHGAMQEAHSVTPHAAEKQFYAA